MLKRLCVLDEHTRECLVIEVHRWIRSQDAILTLSRLMRWYGKPQYLRSDHGADFTANAAVRWLRHQHVGPVLTPGSPWQNGFVESSNAKLRDQCLNRELLRDIAGARVLIERWRTFFDERHPHSAFGCQTPNEAIRAALTRPTMAVGLTV